MEENNKTADVQASPEPQFISETELKAEPQSAAEKQSSPEPQAAASAVPPITPGTPAPTDAQAIAATQTESEKQNKKNRLHRSSVIGYIFLAAVSTLFYLGVFILLSNLYQLLLVSLIWLLALIYYLKRNKAEPKKIGRFFFRSANVLICILMIVAAFFIVILPFSVNSKAKWKYDLHKKYCREKHSFELNDFPEELPKGIDDYQFNAYPSFFEGSGYLEVLFRAPDDVIEKYEKECVEKAEFTAKLSDFEDHRIKLKRLSPKPRGVKKETMSPDVPFNDDFWECYSNEATVYFIDGNKQEGFIGEKFVLINKAEGMIEFVEEE